MATYKSIKYIIPTEAVEHTDSINALADVDTTTVAPSVGQTLKWSAANSRWQPADIEEAASSGTQKGLFAFGSTYSQSTGQHTYYNTQNLLSSSGVIATDTTGVGTGKARNTGSSYGGDKGIFGFGQNSLYINTSNLVSNIGVMSNDQTGVGTVRRNLAACSYGGDKAIFGFGHNVNPTGGSLGPCSITNLVSNAGVVATDTAGVGTARYGACAAAGYGGDKGIFGFGMNATAITNLVSNTGVVASDGTGVGTARGFLGALGYGGDKAIFGFGVYTGAGYIDYHQNITNLVSNTGVVSSDVTGVGTARSATAASGYGGDKGIFAYGYTPSAVNTSNLVSNTGVVASDTTGVGTSRGQTATGYSSTA